MNSCAKKLAREFVLPLLNTSKPQQKIVLEVLVNIQSSRDDELVKSQSLFQAEIVGLFFYRMICAATSSKLLPQTSGRSNNGF
jgi:hypothetical protein